MGQQPSNSSLCCWTTAAHIDQSAGSKDLVVGNIGAAQSREEVAQTGDNSSRARREVLEETIQRGRPLQPHSFCGCDISLQGRPEVEVSAIQPRKAKVSWHWSASAHRFHLEVLRLPCKNEQARGIAFFGVDGAVNSFELPEGTLERASGPYSAQVIAEHGTPERPRLSHPGTSPTFFTAAEPPSAVLGLGLMEEPTEHEFRIQWDAPCDDGGAQVEGYRLVLQLPTNTLSTEDREPELLALDEHSTDVIRDSTAQGVPTVKTLRTKSLMHLFSGLPPGHGPYLVEVCAKTAAGLHGEAAVLQVCTAVAAPAAPTMLRARLLPCWPCGAERGLSPPRASGTEVGSCDIDIIRLEFRAPHKDGGRALESYLIYTEEESNEGLVTDAGASAGENVPVQKPGPCLPVCPVAASDASCTGQMIPGCPCMCDVAVEPNHVYIFSVEASNGALRSGSCDPAPSVFVPARVPLPPRGPLEVRCAESGLAAELRWVGPITGGGMPLVSFKIGVLGPIPASETCSTLEQSEIADVQREVKISCAGALAAGQDACRRNDWQPPLPLGSQEALYGARVEGLQASTKYHFVLAASNAMGTGQWSKPSLPVWTSVAAPATPVNAVATVAVDRDQHVVVTVTWECGRGQADSSPLAAFQVMLMPKQVPTSGASTSSSDTALHQRIIASGDVSGRRVSWASPLTQPGHYVVEITAENTAGQCSPPAVLALDVRPEAFPPRLGEPPDTPHWSEEPLLVLGPAPPGEALFEGFDPGAWLLSLLLWHDSDPGCFSASATVRASPGLVSSLIDVVCNFRCPGSGVAHCVTLATGVTASRLQVALPAHVPMSLRLVVRPELPSRSTAERSARARERPAAKVQSEPLLVLMSESSEHLKPVWEVWSRNSPDGQPPRWRELPELHQGVFEVSWLEGRPHVSFEISSGIEGGTGALLPGCYNLTFGDERQVQHSIRRAGLTGWNAKVRRTVRDSDGEGTTMPTMAAEDQCVVCMERRRTHAFMHADTSDGHLAVCVACAEAYKADPVTGNVPQHARTCPMCRRSFFAVQRIYR